MEKMKKTSVCFDDVLLSPQYSTITSRKEIDMSTSLRNVKFNFRMPIVASPMDTITEDAMAYAMLKAGGLGVIHRYNSVKEQSAIAAHLSSMLINEGHWGTGTIAAAVGVTGDFIDRARSLYDAGVRILCIDVAHGHHILVKNAITEIRNNFGNTVHIMAGNVATLQAFDELATWGADSIRVGIGGGSICSTRIQTGHGVPTLQSIIDCSVSKYAGTVQIIADGGIKTSGDIVKALAAGADFVMLGSLLSGTEETPGEILEESQSPPYEYLAEQTATGYEYKGPSSPRKHKVYRGMASKEAQVSWRGYQSSEEGVSTTVECKGPVTHVLDSLVTGIRSGLSYSGARTIAELHSKAHFIRQSSSGATESNTHILLR
jgi:IMP dehydrogenase